jgi:hypothetical protein
MSVVLPLNISSKKDLKKAIKQVEDFYASMLTNDYLNHDLIDDSSFTDSDGTVVYVLQGSQVFDNTTELISKVNALAVIQTDKGEVHAKLETKRFVSWMRNGIDFRKQWSNFESIFNSDGEKQPNFGIHLYNAIKSYMTNKHPGKTYQVRLEDIGNFYEDVKREGNLVVVVKLTKKEKPSAKIPTEKPTKPTEKPTMDTPVKPWIAKVKSKTVVPVHTKEETSVETVETVAPVPKEEIPVVPMETTSSNEPFASIEIDKMAQLFISLRANIEHSVLSVFNGMDIRVKDKRFYQLLHSLSESMVSEISTHFKEV